MKKQDANNKKKIAFPRMGNYHIIFEDLVNLLDAEAVIPPPITKRTIELGTKYSPEFVCVPFKYNLGNFIEALENGANTLIQAGGGCRYGYYAETQSQILKDLGYKFKFLKFSNSDNLVNFAKDFKRLNPKLTYPKLIQGFHRVFWKMLYLEKIEDLIRRNVGFEISKGEFEKLEKSFLVELKEAKKIKDIIVVGKSYSKKIRKVKVDKGKDILKIGIVGEFYLVIEPFTNYFLEKNPGKKGIEVHRVVTLGKMLKNGLLGNIHMKKLLRYANPYVKYHIGAHGTESVALSHKFYKKGYDGIIHLKPFGCIPEVNAMSALQRLSKEKKFPIIYFSFDSHTSETGIKTRLEAFYDMLKMRRKNEVKS